MTKLEQMEAIILSHEISEAMKLAGSVPVAPPVIKSVTPEPTRKEFGVIGKRNEAFESVCSEYAELFNIA